jgi:TPR repeat protein
MEQTNREISFEEAKKLAEQGDADSQCFLGMVYYAGKQVTKNVDESLKWYRKAVAQGHSTAEFYLKHALEAIGDTHGNK